MKDGKRLKVRSPRSKSEAAIQAWITRRKLEKKAKSEEAWVKAHASEKKSKRALKRWCKENRWKVLFFEGPTGAPRTGIVDAVIARILPDNPDAVEISLVQLKSGNSGLTAKELNRLKNAPSLLLANWLFAAFDGKRLELAPGIPESGGIKKK